MRLKYTFKLQKVADNEQWDEHVEVEFYINLDAFARDLSLQAVLNDTEVSTCRNETARATVVYRYRANVKPINEDPAVKFAQDVIDFGEKFRN